jgi:hypothetical protein
VIQKRSIYAVTPSATVKRSSKSIRIRAYKYGAGGGLLLYGCGSRNLKFFHSLIDAIKGAKRHADMQFCAIGEDVCKPSLDGRQLNTNLQYMSLIFAKFG